MPAWTNNTQQQALSLRDSGSTNQDIASTLGFSTRTVERHLGPKMATVPPPPTSPPGQPVVVPGSNAPWYRKVPKEVLIVGGVVILAGAYLIYRRRKLSDSGIDTGNPLSGTQYAYQGPPIAGTGGGYSGSSDQGGTSDSDVTPVWLTNLSDAILGSLDQQNQTLADFVANTQSAQSPQNPSAGGDPTQQRIIDLFNRYGVPLTYTVGPSNETADERIARIAREVSTGDRTYSQVENSIRYLAEQRK